MKLVTFEKLDLMLECLSIVPWSFNSCKNTLPYFAHTQCGMLIPKGLFGFFFCFLVLFAGNRHRPLSGTSTLSLLELLVLRFWISGTLSFPQIVTFHLPLAEPPADRGYTQTERYSFKTKHLCLKFQRANYDYKLKTFLNL